MSAPTELGVALASTYISQAIPYFIVVGLAFLVTRRWAAAALATRRISVRGRLLDGAQIRRELGHSALVIVLGAAQVLAIEELRRRGLVHVGETLGSLGWAGAALAVAGLILGNDLWFYLVHRALHTRLLFRYVHSVHHRSVDINPFSSYSFHLVEALLVTGWLLPLLLVVSIPLPVLAVVQVIGLANNVMAHLGYELLPRWWVRTPILRLTNSATFHAMHHQGSPGNFGLFTRIWDRLFGTEIRGYEDAFERAHGAHDAPAVEPVPRREESI